MAKRATAAAPKKDERTGRWSFVVDGGVGPNGERRQVRRRGFRTRSEAQEALDAIRGKARTRTYVAPAKITVKAYLDQWIEGLPAKGLRASSVDGYRRNMSYVNDQLGGRRLDSITSADLNALYAHLLAAGRRQKPGGGLSARSVRYVHTVLHRALEDAVELDLLSRNPATKASPPSAKSARAPEMTWWEPPDLVRFLDLTKDEPLGPVFALAALTGLRRGEVLGLSWDAVDLDGASLEVRQQLVVVRSPGAPDGGLRLEPRLKTDHGRRKIGLGTQAVAALRTQRRRQAEQRMATGAGWSNPHNLVFTEPDGSWLDPESVAATFARRVARHKMPRIRFHDLRHSHVAYLIRAGQNPLAISKRLGHHSPAFSLSKYGHLFADADTEAAAAVEALVFGA